MTTRHIVVIGGGSGIGLAVARRFLADQHRVTIAGRSPDRLDRAADQLGGPTGLGRCALDVVDEAAVSAALDELAPFDHVVITAADATGAYAPITEQTVAAAERALTIKVLGPWIVAKHAARHLPPDGSLTMTSGIAAYRPAPGGSAIATANGALEALCRALALELAPRRVNVVSPGWVDTPIWMTVAGDDAPARLAAMADRLPVGHIGSPDDLAAAFASVVENRFMTATVVHVDGGQRLV